MGELEREFDRYRRTPRGVMDRLSASLERVLVGVGGYLRAEFRERGDVWLLVTVALVLLFAAAEGR